MSIRLFVLLLYERMPESGTLGLSIWQLPAYLICGVLISAFFAFILPKFLAYVFERNNVMAFVIFTYVSLIFLLCLVAIVKLAKSELVLSVICLWSCSFSHLFVENVLENFVVQERNRLRFFPIATYYQNFISLLMIFMEIVQLNSLSFDPSVKWSETDQIPKIVQWLGSFGITDIGINQVELKALLCSCALLFWFFLLKCANKFQDSNLLLNRILTKDLPSIMNGVMYMVSCAIALFLCV